MAVERKTVDLSAYPDLVVIYLGMRVRTLTGLKTLRLRPTDSEGRRGPPARPSSLREQHYLQPDSSSLRHAMVLARL
jgi:hypothetical protein